MPQTDFADDLADTEEPSKESIAKDEDGVPYCVKHHCRMKIASSGRKGSKVSYYKCPVDECNETAKRIKTNRESSIPSEPRHCERCSTEESRVVMERSKRHSNAAKTVLVCPVCSHRSEPLPRPELVASYMRTQPRRNTVVPDIGDR